MRTVALDVDGVLVDFAYPYWTAAERILNRDLPDPSEWSHGTFEHAMRLTYEESSYLTRQLQREDNIGYKLDFMDGAAEFVNKLSETHDVFFLTAQFRGFKHWVTQRENLLKQAFPDLNVAFMHEKWRCHFDCLVDDLEKNCRDAGTARSVLFSQPWNRNVRGLRRAWSYDDILEMAKGGEL